MKKLLLYIIILLTHSSILLMAENQNCTQECNAYTSNKTPRNSYCQDHEIDLHTNSYNKDSLYAQTYLLTLENDSTVIAMNAEGLFSDLELTKYTSYSLNYSLEDATIPTVGEHLSLLDGCYRLRKNGLFEVSPSIEITAVPVCIEGFGYMIDLTITGGQTAYRGASGINTSYTLNFQNSRTLNYRAKWDEELHAATVRIMNEEATPFDINSTVNLSAKDGDGFYDCFVEKTVIIEETDTCEIFLKAIPDQTVIYSNYQDTFTFNVLDNDIGDDFYLSGLSNVPNDLKVSWKLNGDISLTATTNFCPENYAEEITYRIKDNHGNESEAIVTVYVFREDKIEIDYDWDCTYVQEDPISVYVFISGGLFPKYISGTTNLILYQPDTLELLVPDGYGFPISLSIVDTLGHETYFEEYGVYCHHYYTPITPDIECITDNSASYGFSDYTLQYHGFDEEDIFGMPNNSILYNGDYYFSYFQDYWGVYYGSGSYGTISCFKAHPDYLKTRFHTKTAAINVLCNDISLTPQLADIDEPQNGTLQWETNGNVFYTPNEGFLGLERLIYTLQNAEGTTDTSILTIEVTAVDGISTKPPLLKVNDQRDCSDFEATGLYQVYLHIEGGYPPYTLTGDTSLVIDTAGIFGPFDYSDTEGYYFLVRDAMHYFTEIDEKLCQANCANDGYFTETYHLICQDDNRAILEYQTECVEELKYYYDYYLLGNQNGDTLDVWETFDVYAVEAYELDTIWHLHGINDCQILPELTAMNDTIFAKADTFKIFNVFGNDIGNDLKMIDVFSTNETANFTWVANGSIYFEAGSEADTTVLQYVVSDKYGQKDTAEVWVRTYKLFRLEAEKDCSSIIPNEFCRYTLNAIMFNGVPPYELKVFDAANDSVLFTGIFEDPFSFYTDYILYRSIDIYLTATDALGTEILEHIPSICSSFGCAYYTCNEDCFDTNLAIENVRYVCNGDGTVDLEYDITGGDGNYKIECGYESGAILDINDIIEIDYNIVVLDGNNCSAEVFVNPFEGCLPTLQNDTLYLQTNTSSSFNILANDIGEGLQLDTIFAANENLSFTWQPDGTIQFEAQNDTSTTLLQYVTTDLFSQQDTAQIFVQILPQFMASYEIDCSQADSTGLVNIQVTFNGGAAPYQVTGVFNEVFEEAGSFSFTLADNSSLELELSSILLNTTITFNDYTSCAQICANLQITPTYDCLITQTQDSIALLTYQTTGGDGNYTFNGTPQNDTLQNGDIYQIEVTDGNGCTAMVSDTIACNFTSIENPNPHSSIPNISLFPNPNNGNFTLSLELKQAEEVDIEILDIMGRVQVKTRRRLKNTATFERHDLPSGLYFIRVSGKDWTWTEKVVVE
ncbi:MAG: T9SS type A sorting domain-containing protein [Chitinophagales bacterium]